MISFRHVCLVSAMVVATMGCNRRGDGAQRDRVAERVATQGITTGPAASEASAATGQGPAAPATGVVVENPPQTPQRCLNEQEVKEYDSLGWKLGGPMSVVRVAREDTLKLRRDPLPSAPIVMELASDQSQIVPTRRVCFVEERPWYQVKVQGATGWVNSQYIRRTTTVHDRTQDYRKRFGERGAATPAELVKRITDTMNNPPQTEGKYEAIVLDTQVRDTSATATLYSCCELDDSVAGDQTLVTMKKTDSGWQFERAEGRYLCYRGLNQDGTLCL